MRLSNSLDQVNTVSDILGWIGSRHFLGLAPELEFRTGHEATLSIITILILSSVIFEYKYLFHLRRNLLFLGAYQKCQLYFFPNRSRNQPSFQFSLGLIYSSMKVSQVVSFSMYIMQFPGFPLLPMDFLNSIKSLNHSQKVFILWK